MPSPSCSHHHLTPPSSCGHHYMMSLPLHRRHFMARDPSHGLHPQISPRFPLPATVRLPHPGGVQWFLAAARQHYPPASVHFCLAGLLVAQGPRQGMRSGPEAQAQGWRRRAVLVPKGQPSLWQAKWPRRAIPRKGAISPLMLLLLLHEGIFLATDTHSQHGHVGLWPWQGPSQRLPDVRVASAANFVQGPTKPSVPSPPFTELPGPCDCDTQRWLE